MSTLTRKDLVEAQLARPPRGEARPAGAVRAGITGSGDDLLVLTWTAADLVRERAAGTRVLRRLGLSPGMRVANTLPGALATPGSLLLGDVVEELGALDVPLGAITTPAEARAAWELADRVTPEVIVVPSGSAGPFLSSAPPAARPWWRGLVRLRTDASETHVPTPDGFAGWERTWLAVPEVTSFVAGSCPANRLHLDEDVVARMSNGRLVLARRGASGPAYLTELRMPLHPGPCVCGADGQTLEVPT